MSWVRCMTVDGGIPVEDLWGARVPAPSPLKDDEPMMITHTSSGPRSALAAARQQHQQSEAP
jgi:hypothetical protein